MNSKIFENSGFIKIGNLKDLDNIKTKKRF